MSNQDEDVKKKLVDLELSLKEGPDSPPLTTQPGRTGFAATTEGIKRALNQGGTGIKAVGGIMMAVATLMILNRVQVSFGGVSFFGMGAAGVGIIFLPLLIGIGLVFYNHKKKMHWYVAGGGIVFVILSLLMQVKLYFSNASLLEIVTMFALFFGGAGVLAKAFFPSSDSDS